MVHTAAYCTSIIRKVPQRMQCLYNILFDTYDCSNLVGGTQQGPTHDCNVRMHLMEASNLKLLRIYAMYEPSSQQAQPLRNDCGTQQHIR
jgi:hypothetical protein